MKGRWRRAWRNARTIRLPTQNETEALLERDFWDQTDVRRALSESRFEDSQFGRRLSRHTSFCCLGCAATRDTARVLVNGILWLPVKEHHAYFRRPQIFQRSGSAHQAAWLSIHHRTSSDTASTSLSYGGTFHTVSGLGKAVTHQLENILSSLRDLL